MARRRKQKRNAKRPRRLFRGVMRVFALVVVAGVVAGAGAIALLWPRCSGEECPDVRELRDYSPPQASRVFDRNSVLVAHLAPERRIVVPLEQIPSVVASAFLAVEDKRFFRHDGVDYRRVGGALVRNVRSQRFEQGFSTITMQLARNVFPEHLTRAKTIRRKVSEVSVAREIEREFSKDQILEMYLNQIYLGEGYYGVEAAAQGYFGKSARELDAQEAALLAALPKAPTHFNPRRNPESALTRRNLVIALMREERVISDSDAERLRDEPLGIVPPIESRGEAPYLVAAVRRELAERFGPDAETAGLRVFTTLDPVMQRTAERALRAQIEAIEGGRHGRYPHASCAGGATSDPSACLQGMFVAIDVHSGDVLSLVGGRDFALSQFDRAMQARRQAGSAFKPFVYAAGLAAGIPVSTQLVGPGLDEYEGGYRPADHVSDTLHVDMREGMRLSSNRAAVALGERVGANRVVHTARTLGLTTPIEEYPSTFLGAADVVPLELVAAYTAFAAEGVYVKPRLIQRVEDAQGRVIWDNPVVRRAVIAPEVAFLTNNLMRDVVDRGTGSAARRAGLPYSIPAAGKTGTTNDASDVWFVGVTPDIAAGVWLGFDRPRRIMIGASGGGLAAPVWGTILASHYEKRAAPRAWEVPSTVIAVEIDRESGLLATHSCPEHSRVTELFIQGTEPHEYCYLHPEGIEGWFRRTVRGMGDWFRGSPGGVEPRQPPRMAPRSSN
jgi:penicillin-binding protein 1A